MKYYMHHDDYQLTPEMANFSRFALSKMPQYWWREEPSAIDTFIGQLIKEDIFGIPVNEEMELCARYFLKWIATVRNLTGHKKNLYGEGWVPGEIDTMKSRLFWWIRSGHTPLKMPPPTAYSCPWYEVVVLNSIHSCMDAHFFDTVDDDPFHHRARAVLSQCSYDLIKKNVSTDPDTQAEVVEYIVGFGNYRFRAWQDVDFTRKRLLLHNPHQAPEQIEGILPSVCSWVLQRQIELEEWDGEPQPFLEEI